MVAHILNWKVTSVSSLEASWVECSRAQLSGGHEAQCGFVYPFIGKFNVLVLGFLKGTIIIVNLYFFFLLVNFPTAYSGGCRHIFKPHKSPCQFSLFSLFSNIANIWNLQKWSWPFTICFLNILGLLTLFCNIDANYFLALFLFSSSLYCFHIKSGCITVTLFCNIGGQFLFPLFLFISSLSTVFSASL